MRVTWQLGFDCTPHTTTYPPFADESERKNWKKKQSKNANVYCTW